MSFISGKNRTAIPASEKGVANGVATLDGTGNVPATQLGNVSTSTPLVIHVQDQKPSGTQGGSSTAATQNVRTLNTVVTNTISGASLSSNQITLPAGTFEVWASASCYTVGRHKIRLYNITDSATAAVGESMFAENTNLVNNYSRINGDRFTIAASKTFRLEHYTQNGILSNGLGFSVTSGDVEIYANVRIVKVA